MDPGVMLRADLILDRLGHLELRYKQAGDFSGSGGIRLAIVEVLRLVEESKPRSPGADIPATSMHL